MAALLIALSLLLGAPVASIAGITTLQWVIISLNLVSGAKDAIKYGREADAIIHSPQFAQWVAANGEEAIRLRPGIVTQSGVAY